MAYTKVFSTTFGVTVAVVHATGSFANDSQVQNNIQQDVSIPYSGAVYELPSDEIMAIDLYQAIFPSVSFNKNEFSRTHLDINIYKQENGRKKLITEESIVLSPDIHPLEETQIFYFEDKSVNWFDLSTTHEVNSNSEINNVGFGSNWEHQPNNLATQGIRIGALISGGPDGIVTTSLIKEAGSLEGHAIQGYDFFYIKSGRPSDWQEFQAIDNYVQGHFSRDMYNLHIIDMSLGQMRMVLCGEYEATYSRFGLSSALSMVAAKCEKLKDKPNVILFGIHGADAFFKAKTSNEYTRHFVNSWNKFWKSFYPQSPLFIAPLIDVFDKIDILKMAQPLGVDISLTWSCYEGNTYHCGKCKSCLERRLAYQMAKKTDPTQYKNTPDIRRLKNHIGGVAINDNDQRVQLSF